MKPTRSYAPEMTRQLLMEAALDLFAERGFRETSIQDVVERAGLTKGAFYHHFRTKEDALRILHDAFLDLVTVEQDRALAEFSSPTEQLWHVTSAITQICIEYQKHVRVFYRERHGLSGDVRVAVLAKRRVFTKRFQDIVARGIAAGEFSVGPDADVAALGVLGTCIWAYQWYRPDGRRRPEEIADQLGRMALLSVGVGPDRIRAIARSAGPGDPG
ncbi:TetR/AcrR family transcriptional regulator [Baekduia soli]|nr:TetR/AcrR family transcriptional regulator [Baekduia soli]